MLTNPEFLLFAGHQVLLLAALVTTAGLAASGRDSAVRLWPGAAALAVLAASVVVRTIGSGRLPLASMYEFGLLFLLALELALLLLRRRLGSGLPAVIGLATTFGLGCAFLALYQPPANLAPSLESPWLAFHVLTAVGGYGLATAAFATGLAGLLAWKRPGGRPLARRMASLGNHLVLGAFPLFTLMIASGAVWAEYAWGAFWRWDPKEVWALVTWLVYLVHLHGVRVQGWQGRRALVMPVLGWLVVLFSFFGVNLLFAGLHSYR